MENDARAAAVGAIELLWETEPELRNVAYLAVGTGLSAGLILDGRLHRGAAGMAGEIGHVVIDPTGPPCRCGLRGCLEVLAAGRAVERLWPAEDGNAVASLYAAAEGGDAQAAKLAGRVSRYVAQAVHWVVMAYDVERVVLGGGVGSVGEPLLSRVRAELSALGERSELARFLLPPHKVITLPPSHPTGAMGAVALARRHISDLQDRAGERRLTKGGV